MSNDKTFFIIFLFQPSYMDIMDIRRQCPKKSNIGKQFLILWCYMTPCRMAIYYHGPKLLPSKTEWLWQHTGEKPMFSGRESFCNEMFQENVCRDKGKKIGMALTISDNLWQPFVWGWVQFRSAQQSHWREPVFLPSSNISHCF